jgi:hypothetical protein
MHNTRKIAIIQSNYIPWKGYFDLINMVDEFILYDIVQYTKNDWRNRNVIKTPNGQLWLTIPIFISGRFGQRICDAEVSDMKWHRRHWQSIITNYRKAAYFNVVSPFIENMYQSASDMNHLSEINSLFIRGIADLLGIKTKITSVMDYHWSGNKNEALINLIKQCGGNEYLSGPAAREYLDVNLFRENAITVTWMDYSGYPEYDQLHPPFEHRVSIIDMLLNLGAAGTKKYMKSFS